MYTIIDMATAYGSALGLDSTGLLLALLVTQIVAFPCAIIFGRLSYKVSTEKLILVCIVAYLGIAVFAIFLRSQLQFWILAILVGMFQVEYRHYHALTLQRLFQKRKMVNTSDLWTYVEKVLHFLEQQL